MRLEAVSRRALLAAATFASLPLAPLPSHADVPTYSLKGIPGISAITGSDAPPPSDLGVIGRGTDGSKPGVRARALDKHPI